MTGNPPLFLFNFFRPFDFLAGNDKNRLAIAAVIGLLIGEIIDEIYTFISTIMKSGDPSVGNVDIYNKDLPFSRPRTNPRMREIRVYGLCDGAMLSVLHN